MVLRTAIDEGRNSNSSERQAGPVGSFSLVSVDDFRSS